MVDKTAPSEGMQIAERLHKGPRTAESANVGGGLSSGDAHMTEGKEA